MPIVVIYGLRSCIAHNVPPWLAITLIHAFRLGHQSNKSRLAKWSDRSSICAAEILNCACLNRVRSGLRERLTRCPLFSRKRTRIGARGMSAKCHEDTSPPKSHPWARDDIFSNFTIELSMRCEQQKCLRGLLNPLRRSGGAWLHSTEGLARCQRYRGRGFGPKQV